MQTFNADIRKEMQRLDSPEYIIRRLEEISAIDNLAVVIDLLRLPGTKGKVWTDDLKIVSELPIDGSVDCYQLNVFEKSPLNTRIKSVFVIRQRRLLKPPTCMLKALSIFLLIPIGIV